MLYNSVSGATHLLGAGAVFLLDLLANGPLDHSALVAALHGEFELDQAQASAELAALLAMLAKIDLIEPC